MGDGAFGAVDLVRHSVSGTLFAMKAIDVVKVAELELLEYLKSERTIMESLDSPFIARLVRTFEEKEGERILEVSLLLASGFLNSPSCSRILGVAEIYAFRNLLT